MKKRNTWKARIFSTMACSCEMRQSMYKFLYKAHVDTSTHYVEPVSQEKLGESKWVPYYPPGLHAASRPRVSPPLLPRHHSAGARRGARCARSMTTGTLQPTCTRTSIARTASRARSLSTSFSAGVRPVRCHQPPWCGFTNPMRHSEHS